MPRNVYPFKTRADVIRFAKIFVRRRIGGFRKDIRICLTSDANDDKAFMPGLMSTISVIDLLSGLYAGKVEWHNEVEFNSFVQEFMPGRYDPYELRVLYVAFRHKLAHLSHPYFVLNTNKAKKLKQRAMLLSWVISSDAHEPPIRLEALRQSRLIRKQPVPWPMRVDHYMHISIRTLADDAIKLSRAYVKKLQSDPDLWEKFRDCMPEFYQT